MLIQESFKDVPTQNGGTMRIFTFHPQIPNYPKAKFPGVVVFSEIYQGECNAILMNTTVSLHIQQRPFILSSPANATQ
jgi:dienelactone hydrolase